MTKDNIDYELFKAAMKAVKPLKKENKLGYIKTPTKKWVKQSLPDNSQNKYLVSDHEVETVTIDSKLSFYRNGLQPRHFRKLSKGQFLIEDVLDLHGYSIDDARSLLLSFVERAQEQGIRVVKIIHGKGFRGNELKPILKNKVNTWLQQLPCILAFCSCQPKDGGNGAVYVLLKRTVNEST